MLNFYDKIELANDYLNQRNILYFKFQYHLENKSDP